MDFVKGKTTLQFNQYQVGDFVKELANYLRRDFQPHNIELEVVPNYTGSVYMDKAKMQRAIFNISFNARDAMPQGGQLDIRAFNQSIDDEYCARHPNARVGDFVCISVKDSGTGMDDDTQEHLFEPFYTTKPIGKGTGLGLAMVFGAIQQNKGFVSVESAIGRGSMFSLHFPRCSEAPEQLTDSAQQFINLGGTERVLVVEDDDSVRKLAVKILRGFGYEAVACRNAEEAIVAAKRDRFDLLLTDVILPGENGRQLALRLNEQQPDLKVLYCSGHSEDIIGKQGIVDQSLAFIPKPFTAQQLAHKLREVLDDKRDD
jgi:two-component system cell cycle sensor histidine kinase/response regulator CckA